MTELENLQIYQKYLDLIYYSNMILKKFPKSERYAIASDIKNCVYEGMEKIIYCYKAYDKSEKLIYLNQVDVKLKMLKVLIRVCYRSKYINGQNYEAWCRKILNISNLMGGWMKACRRQ